MNTIVQKYGGTSVGTIERIKNVAKQIISQKQTGQNIVVVVSAMGNTTNRLLDMAKQISKNPRKRELDTLISTGEQQSIALLSMALNELKYESVSLTGFQAGIKTVGMHTKNRIAGIELEKINKYLDTGKIVVVAGFQGINQVGDITTLGRGGSDITAVALAAKLKCRCEIYTDVEGVYSVDPRLFPQATKLQSIDYLEMMEMASLGARIMEARAVELGYQYDVPIYVASSTKHTAGTLIRKRGKTMEDKGVTGLTVVEDVLMITINNVTYGAEYIAKIFEMLANLSVNVDMISQTAPHNDKVNISFTCPGDDLGTIQEVETQLISQVHDLAIDIDKDLCKLSLIGIGMMTQPGIAAKIFKTLADSRIMFKIVSTSEISVSFTINKSDKHLAVTQLAKSFDL